MARSFYATRISDKLSRTPEGYLLAVDCVIGRTGFQTYNVRDLPKNLADELGIDTSDPSAEIDLYRAADEVFDKATISSFEGKPVTDNHPGDGFVDPKNFNQYARGHVQNVHRGAEALESGEFPLMADILITVDSLIAKVENERLRELSCGYDYSLARDGDTLMQIGIRGNHVAVVPKGRAGSEARIYDSALGNQITEDAPAAAVPNGEIKPTTEAEPLAKAASQKEKFNVPNVATKRPPETNWIRRVFGLGLRAMAQDESTSPEELAEAASAVTDGEEKEEAPAPVEDRRADDRRADDRRAGDEDPDDDDEEAPARDSRHVNRGRGGWQHKDAAADGDHRSRMHSTLDRILDELMPEEKEQPTEDADMQELRELLSEYMGEEAGEPEHQEDDELPPEFEEQAGAGDEGNEAEVIEPPNAREELTGTADRRGRDGRAADAANELAFLRRMQRSCTRANDSRGLAEVSARMARLTRTTRPVPAGAGYGGFHQAAARSRAADSTLAVNGQADLQKLQETYDKVLRGKPVEEGK